MSFKIILAGMLNIILTIAVSVAAIFMVKDPQTMSYFLYAIMGIGAVFGIITCIIAFTTNGVIGPLMAAKSSGNTMLAVLTASGKIRLRQGREQEGFISTKDGSFCILPGSMYRLPNGVPFGMAYYKIGATIPSNFSRACTVLKDSGVRDIVEAEAVNEAAKAKGEDVAIDLEGEYK
jgi:hypothetical protein